MLYQATAGKVHQRGVLLQQQMPCSTRPAGPCTGTIVGPWSTTSPCRCSIVRTSATASPSTPDQPHVLRAATVAGSSVLTAQPAMAGILPNIEGVDQVVVGVGFTVAIALLTVVTAGVWLCGVVLSAKHRMLTGGVPFHHIVVGQSRGNTRPQVVFHTRCRQVLCCCALCTPPVAHVSQQQAV